MQKAKNPHGAPAGKAASATLNPNKQQEKGKLALDESTLSRLLEVRKKAFSDNPEISIDRALFDTLLKNQNAAVAVMKTDGAPAGYVVANPINEGWVKGDVQEIKDVMKPHMDDALFEKISAAMGGGSCYYLDDLAIAKRGMGTAGMMRGFFSQLQGHSAKFLVLHGRMANRAYELYQGVIEKNGFRKIHENVHPNWFGGEDFMLMVFEKA